MSNKKEIGKGIDGLFDHISVKKKSKSEDKAAHGQELLVNIDDIVENSHQPRTSFDAKKLLELSMSIKENGILQPLTVIKKEDNKYELIAGERRLRASKLAGLKEVPVIIKSNIDSEKKSVLALIENVQREDLNSIEIAYSLNKMVEDFSLTHDEISKKVGIPRSNVSNYLRLINLPEETQEMIKEDKISFGHAKVLVSLKDKDQIIKLSNEIVSKSLSVAKLNSIIRKEEDQVSPKKTEETSEKEETVITEKVEKIKEKYNLKHNKRKITFSFKDDSELEKFLDLLS